MFHKPGGGRALLQAQGLWIEQRAHENLSAMCGCLRGGLLIVYMAEFKFKFIYKCVIICIDCFVVNTNVVLLKIILFYYQ